MIPENRWAWPGDVRSSVRVRNAVSLHLNSLSCRIRSGVLLKVRPVSVFHKVELDISVHTAVCVQVEYQQLDVVQLRFLRLHSESASQTVRVSCPAPRRLPAARLWFLGDSGHEVRFSSAVGSRKRCEVKQHQSTLKSVFIRAACGFLLEKTLFISVC